MCTKKITEENSYKLIIVVNYLIATGKNKKAQVVIIKTNHYLMFLNPY